MRDDPGIPEAVIATCLASEYHLRVDSVVFLPLGHDTAAAVYEVMARDGASYFLKIRTGPVFAPGLLVPRALIDRGIRRVLAPLRTHTSQLWCPLAAGDRRTVVLYPFLRGENAKVSPMTDDQWRIFGDTLRAVHASGLMHRFRGQLREETFALPSAAMVRRVSAMVAGSTFESPAADAFAAFWRANAGRIHHLLARAETLGRSLQSQSFELVLCHGDIHGANILIGEDDGIWLVDWDGPLIAPRERDLLFVVSSEIARRVEPRNEDCFFEGYGATEIDRDALIYYRYERTIEDIGEFGRRVFLDTTLSESTRATEARLIMDLFGPTGFISRVATVPHARWPRI